MRKEDEFAGVDPARLAEVKRRITILRRYLEIEKPSGTDAVDAAREMGVGISLFYTLLRIWKKTRRPADLPGAQTPGGRRTGYAHLPPAAEALMADAIAANRGKHLRQITQAIRAAFRSAGLPSPSGFTIALRAQRAMGDNGYWPKFRAGTVLVLIAFQIDATIVGSDGEALAWIVMARHAENRRLLAWSLSLEPPTGEECRGTLIAGLRSLTDVERRAIGTEGPPSIGIARPIRIDQTDIARIAVYSGWTIDVGDEVSVDMARGLFGPRIAELNIRHWRPGATAGPWRRTPKLDLDELHERIELALGRVDRSAVPSTFDPASYLAERLEASLGRS